MQQDEPMDVDQAALWNGPAGSAWVDAQPVLDAMFRGVEPRLVDAVGALGARRVLDVGCGTGATTLALARHLGADGEALGADISAPMIAVARERAAQAGLPARFVVADAASHRFEPEAFDAIVSRFGVMFFDDPVAAFANLRRALRPGGGLAVVAWRSAAENPFMTAAESAAAPLLPDMQKRRPGAPGQFAFADAGRVRGILEESGWRDVSVGSLDVACAFPASAIHQYVTRLGPVGMALAKADAATRAAATEAAEAALGRFVVDGEARFVAACWMIEARA